MENQDAKARGMLLHLASAPPLPAAFAMRRVSFTEEWGRPDALGIKLLLG
jgi:hypothetical protein